MENLNPEQVTEFTSLKTKLQSLGHKIKVIVEQGRLIASDESQLFLFKGMYKKLDTYFDSFNESWDRFLQLITTWELTSTFPTQQERGLQQAIERYYYEASAIYEHHMNPTPGFPTTAAHTTQPSASYNESRTLRSKLPQINLPQFDGSQAAWPMFRDTYRSIVHDEACVSDMEKFLFLVSCLKGPALVLIQGIELEERNYAQAWKLLNDTYNDKRRLATNHLKSMLSFTPFRKRPTASELKNLLSTVGECVESFAKLKIPHSGEFILFYLVLRCLDPETRRAFEKQHTATEFPTYQQILDFLRVEWRSEDLATEDPVQERLPKVVQHHNANRPVSLGNKVKSSFLVDNRSSQSGFREQKFNVKGTPPNFNCPVCKVSHTLYQCNQFRKMSAEEKIASLKDWTGCTNCLSRKHLSKNCPSTRRCQTCGQAHHSWLHQASIGENHPRSTMPAADPQSEIALGSLSKRGEVLLGTALIDIQDISGTFQSIRIVTDSGSQHSFITESCVQKLGLQIEPCGDNISGIGQVPLNNILGKIPCKLRPTGNASFSFLLKTEAIVVPRITGDLPHVALPSSTQVCFQKYVLADPEYWNPGRVEFLLGGDLFYDIITGRPIMISDEVPRLIPTIFGYIIGGPVRNIPSPQETSVFLIQDDKQLKDALTKFWEVEEVPPRQLLSKEEKFCEDHFASTHYRLPSGRYVVSLPLKETMVDLENPAAQALNRFLNLEKKFSKDFQLEKEYRRFMDDYISLGHMRVAPADTSAYIIPHHAVLKLNNSQLKLRVVFDASCRTAKGSLNDHMYVGPKLQLDIGEVITNFRTHQVVFTTDIVKMYRQILVNPKDRKFQHILWRSTSAEAIQTYELCTVTYGETASPFLAQRTIHQLITDEGASFPLAKKALSEDIYVDDIATGANKMEEAIQLQDQLIALLAKGGFQLSKWASNCPKLLQNLEPSQLGVSAVQLSDEDIQGVKLLGIQWHPSEDIFSYKICPPPWNPTKRAILSAIARMYDPLGYLSPVIFYAKVILQEMWKSNCDWDELGPPTTCAKWKTFLAQTSSLSDIKIPRCITSIEDVSYMIVGFSDASQRGYSAVLYLHATTTSGCHVHVLRAKTKLAPIKPMSIPRLELCGALLLARLLQSCKSVMTKLGIQRATLFTDSQVVLAWLSHPPHLLKTFVAHRVMEILELTTRSQWNFVASQDNPADCSSRGLLPNELTHHPLWWAGPAWLSTSENDWPIVQPELKEDLPEVKDTEITTLIVAEENPFIAWMQRFSSFNKLVRSMAYTLRFINYQGRRKGPISVLEFREANKRCIRITQSCYRAGDELDQIQMAKSKALRSLRPFLDEDGLIRVGGRIQDAELPFDAKHPYLIPNFSHYASLLIDHYHILHAHIGPTALQAIVQGRYWIVSVRKLIRQRVFRCIKCYRTSRSPQVPVMGNLPAYRLAEGKVFDHVGVDFGGPFRIRESMRRKADTGKAYLCLFICMSTKAVHLEVVSACSTEAFLAAFERFIARRGKPMHVYSDCGTNFIGAANRIKELTRLLRSSEAQGKILRTTVPQEIQWSFNPPSAPHFGGLWEAGIKSAK
ncbi:uncharacterized protein [Rhodnius prolixus]|uniref:uncharacterized protein n=1 Tax=Rhodnius prolixus TaxID=13249 RepID=UPI003D18A75D